MKGRKSTKGHKIYAGLVLLWILVVVGAPWLPNTSYVHNLLTYPPPLLLCLPIVGVMLVGLIRACIRRSNRLDQLCLLGALLVGVLLLGINIPFRSPGAETVRVLTLNVEKGNRNVPGLREAIVEGNVDLVMLQEVRGGVGSPAAKLKNELPGWHIETVGELALLSRWPLSDVQSTPLRSLPGRYVLTATVGAPTPFRAMTTHWSVPQFRKGWAGFTGTIDAQIHDYEDTIRVLERERLPVILGGDFNNPPRHALSRKLGQRMEDAWLARGFGPGWTYPKQVPLTRIDHLYSSRPFRAVRCEVGPDFGSDHKSVFAAFATRS